MRRIFSLVLAILFCLYKNVHSQTTPTVTQVPYPRFYLKSPNYPNNYPKNANYQWKVKKSQNVCRVSIDFSSFILEQSANCAKDKFTVNLPEYGTTTTSASYCGVMTGQSKTFVITEAATDFTIDFKTDATTEMQGFTVKVIQHQNSCGKSTGEFTVAYPIFRAISGNFSSGHYGNNIHRIWNVRRSPQCRLRSRVVTLQVEFFNIQPYNQPFSGANCVNDYFSYETNDVEVKRCGFYRPGTIWRLAWPLQSPVLRLKLVSDATIDSGGVKIIVRQC